ncbi:MAG: SDR family NAD(P)-dependent oxidoreductase [Mycobacterium sp.]|nr:SDR family NAD(P)-dependent oxidoreductase [Mycobacterium sp.]
MDTNEVILITHADTDTGYTIARELLAAGHRVAVTARNPGSLSRILLGQKADRVIAVAADIDDAAQRAGILRRAHARFGLPVTRVIDGRDSHQIRPSALQMAS